MKQICQLVKWLHELIWYISIFGIFLPKKYLFYYLFLWPIIFIHWQFNGQRCCLTDLECYLKGIYPGPTVQQSLGTPVRKFLDSHNIRVRKITMYYVSLAICTLLWLIALYRYLS